MSDIVTTDTETTSDEACKFCKNLDDLVHHDLIEGLHGEKLFAVELCNNNDGEPIMRLMIQ